MTVQTSTQMVDSEILDFLDQLVDSQTTLRTGDHLLSEFQFRQYMRKSEKIPDISSRFLIQALLRLNYDMCVEVAEDLFNRSLMQNRYSLTSWTHYPSYLAIRGFSSLAFKYFKEAVKLVPCKGTLFNLYSASIEVRDRKSLSLAATTFEKLYPSEEEKEFWVENAYNFSNLVSNQSKRLNLDEDLITDILLKSQDMLRTHGFRTLGCRHFFEAVRDDVFIIYKIPGVSFEKISELNELIADFMVENDYLNSKLTLVVNVD